MIELLVGAVSGIISKVIPDKDKANELAHEIATLTEKHAHEIAKAQIEVNKVEASHKSLFVSGWRPGAGWVCVVAMAFNYIILPFLNFALLLHEVPVSIAPLDLTMMMPVLLGMLGLGSMRMNEKVKGVAREK